MNSLLAFAGIGTTELMIVAVIALVLFGHRLPQVMGGLGKGIRDFKKGLNTPDDDTDSEAENKFAKPKE